MHKHVAQRMQLGGWGGLRIFGFLAFGISSMVPFARGAKDLNSAFCQLVAPTVSSSVTWSEARHCPTECSSVLHWLRDERQVESCLEPCVKVESCLKPYCVLAAFMACPGSGDPCSNNQGCRGIPCLAT